MARSDTCQIGGIEQPIPVVLEVKGSLSCLIRREFLLLDLAPKR